MSKSFRLGIFVVAMLLVLCAAIFLIGSRESMFKSTYRVRAEFANVAGLEQGAQVSVGGVRQGTVRRIELPKHPGGKMAVVMDLDSATREVIRKDSVASIQSEGLLGDKLVEVSFGTDGAEHLKDGDSIGSHKPIDISDLIAKTNGILDTTSGAMQSVAKMTDNLEAISGKINQGKGTAGALINDKTLYRQATASAAELQEDLEAAKHNFLLRGFFKKRGYENQADLKENSVAKLPEGDPIKVFTYDGKRIFDKPDDPKLKHEADLNNAGQFLEGAKFGIAVVAASAGMKGDSKKAQVLSEARAKGIRDYLVQHFRLDDKRLKTLGVGKSEEGGDDGSAQVAVYPATNAQRSGGK